MDKCHLIVDGDRGQAVSFHAMTFRPLLLLALLATFPPLGSAQAPGPSLQPVGDRHQLFVDGEPFTMLAGELGNSTATTLTSMEPVWPRLEALNLNTVLVPVYWELLEPREGEFDFALVDGLVREARERDLKLVLLWFGSWKNSMSSHAPAWVKLDPQRFPRARSAEGIAQEILTPFSENNLQADRAAYARLLAHLREIDGGHQTVIMVQPENEVGMLPSARDHHPLADQAFAADVPRELVDYLVRHREALNPETLQAWSASGQATEGSWEDLFGVGPHTDELFMAWYFARYVDAVSAAGKREHPLPVFVNAALNRPGRLPGEYPSAGPLPHVMDVWRAASPNIDFYAPDFYTPRFEHWNDLYTRQGNPLFVPEHRFDDTVAAKALFAIGRYEALGFAPFAVEQDPAQALAPKERKLAAVYAALDEVLPVLHDLKGQDRIRGVLLDREVNERVFELGDYRFTAGHTHNLGWEPEAAAEDWESAGAVILHTGEREFLFVGFGVSLTMAHRSEPDTRVGILKAERGHFVDGRWTVHRHLNGDQTHQGRHIRSFIDDVSIQRFTLYEYE